MKIRIKFIPDIFLYGAAIGVSISLLFFVIICSWIGYEVKSQCQEARAAYGGDCVESLVTLLNDDLKML